MRAQGGYWSATRHPWPCLLFLVPLLLTYEVGVLWLGGPHADTLRNGADVWLRWGLESFGLRSLYIAPALVALLFVIWSWRRRHDVPSELFGVWVGMILESVGFALVLWGFSKALGPILDQLGVVLATPTPSEYALSLAITFIGAGIYEEFIFRLLLFAGLYHVLCLALTPRLPAFGIAALISATIFAAAHNIGPYGEPFHDLVFLFRMSAGIYFVFLLQLRGFAVAVGAHACYDVLVGVLVP
ncbi:MAG: type II CAAX prenyl endopeptidase Rce1 family protein [Gemmataceae bacterium]